MDTLRTYLPELLITCAVLAVAVLLQLPSAESWNHADDFRNLQWVVEHRDVPWVALTERVALHGHIRPATWMATWAGAALGLEPWFGVHLMLVTLMFGAFAGIGALTWLTARAAGVSTRWAARGAVVAVLLANGMPGTSVLPWWNAWINTAGEVCAGIWALVFAMVAWQGRRWAWLPALGCLVLAGLFREPGWLVAPMVLVGLAWARRGRPGTVMPVLVALMVAAAGFAFTFHSDNLARMASMDAGLLERVVGFVQAGTVQPVDTWPSALTSREDPFAWAGVCWPLCAWALLRDVLQRDVLADLPGAVLWVCVSGIGLALGPQAGPWVAVWGLAALWRSRSAPQVGLLLFLAGTGAMYTAGPGGSVVQVWAGGLGVAVYVAVHLAEAGAWLRRPSRALVLALVLLEAGQVAWTALHAEQTIAPEHHNARATRAEHLALGALTQALGITHANIDGPKVDLVLADTLGLSVTQDQLLTWANLRIEHRDDASLLAAAQAPQLSRLLQRWDRAPVRGGSRWAVLEEGPVAVGLIATGHGTTAERLNLEDACGRTHTVTAYPGDADHVVRAVWVEPGCAPLAISRQTGSDAWRPFTVPLDAPQVSLWQSPAPMAPPVARVAVR